jgi:hypothetical protein
VVRVYIYTCVLVPSPLSTLVVSLEVNTATGRSDDGQKDHPCLLEHERTGFVSTPRESARILHATTDAEGHRGTAHVTNGTVVSTATPRALLST